jgi:hypothetical protein
MRQTIRSTVIFAGIMAVLPGCATIVVRPIRAVTEIDSNRVKSNGVFYALPRTVITIDAVAKLTESGESPFFLELVRATKEYADLIQAYPDVPEDREPMKTKLRELKMKFVKEIRKDSRYQALIRDLARLGITLTDASGKEFEFVGVTPGVRAEPDPDHVYMIDIAGWPLQDRSFMLDLSEAGLPMSGEAEVTDRTVEVALKTIDLAAQIAGRALLGGTKVTTAAEDPFDEIFKNGTAIIADIKRADKSRLDLVSGSAPGLAGGLPEATLERMLKEVGTIRDGLSSYFSRTKVKTLTMQYAYRPPAPTAGTPSPAPLLTILRVTSTGLNDEEKDPQLQGPPVPAKFKSTAKDGELVQLKIEQDKLSGGAVVQVIDGRKASFDGEHAFFYRIPGSGLITVQRGDEELVRTSVQIAQFGAVAALPSNTGSTSNKYTRVLP